jgi:hypothetical protein
VAALDCGEGGVVTVLGVVNSWRGRLRGPVREGFRGYSPLRELKATLEARGWAVAVRGGRKAHEFPEPPAGGASIARIQWLREDGAEYPWFEAARHSHYVLVRRSPAGDLWVFDNCGGGWRPARDHRGLVAPGTGHVSSVLDVVPAQPGLGAFA